MPSSIAKSVGGIFGANEQVKGQKVAQDMLEGQKAAYNPFVTGGMEGFDQLQQAILGQDNTGYMNYMQRPDIQYQIDQGVDTATQGLAGKGALNSGYAMQQLQGIGQNIAGQGYQNYLGDLSGLAGYGMQGLDAQTGLTRNIADARIGVGQARAGRSQAIGSAWSDIEDDVFAKMSQTQSMMGGM